jgi:hypothetical protein
MSCDPTRPPNRPMPSRTRAKVRGKYLRRALRGTVFQSTQRLPIFALGEMIGALVERRVAIGMSTEEIEHRAGLTDNHAAKVEAGARIPSLDLFLLLVETLGGRVRIEWGAPPKLCRTRSASRVAQEERQPKRRGR